MDGLSPASVASLLPHKRGADRFLRVVQLVPWDLMGNELKRDGTRYSDQRPKPEELLVISWGEDRDRGLVAGVSAELQPFCFTYSLSGQERGR